MPMTKMTNTQFITLIGKPSRPIKPNVHNSPKPMGSIVAMTSSTEASAK
jgi:hypothetical protein